MKLLARIAMILAVAAIFVQLTTLYADFRPRSPRLRFERERQRRPSQPQWNRLPSFLGEFVVVGLIAVGGRKILRLRLAESTSRSDSPSSLRYRESQSPASHRLSSEG
jgi:hypothetical protein